MPLPRKPERSAPIPNQPFDSPEVSTIKGPYWDMPLGSGLEDDGQGSVQTTGSTPSEPSAYLYGSNGFVGLGAGLQLGPNGELEQEGGYIYCTPAYPELPVTYPPYGCNTEVNTAGVTDFTEAWEGCTFTEFPCIDTSSATSLSRSWYNCENLQSFPKINTSFVTDFYSSWCYCRSLESFPKINTQSGEDFSWSWAYSGIASFPLIDTPLATSFYASWCGCYYLQSFPEIYTGGADDFYSTWYACETLTSFPVVDVSSGTNFFFLYLDWVL